MVESGEPVVYINGKFFPQQQASVILQAPEYQSAGGYYDTERTFNGQVFKLRQHLERLYKGLEYSELDPGLTLDELTQVAMDVLETNRHLLGPGEEYTITQVASQSPSTPEGERPRINVVVYCQKLDFAAYARSYVEGVRVVTPSTYAVPAEATQGSAKQGSQRTYPLMSSKEGSITECQGGNFMFVRDGRIKLPDRHNVLPGISMQTVLELAEAIEIPVDEDDYSPLDVYLASEAFVSSTRFCMVPVATINGYSLGEGIPGTVTRSLLDAWREIVGMDFIQQALDHLPTDEPDATSQTP